MQVECAWAEQLKKTEHFDTYHKHNLKTWQLWPVFRIKCDQTVDVEKQINCKLLAVVYACFSTSFLSTLLVLFFLCKNWEPFVYGAVMSVTQVVQTGTCTHANDYKWVFWWHSTPYSRMSLHSTLHLHLRKPMGAQSLGTESHCISAIISCDSWVAQCPTLSREGCKSSRGEFVGV